MEAKKKLGNRFFVFIVFVMMFVGSLCIFTKVFFQQSLVAMAGNLLFENTKQDDFEEKWSRIANRESIDDMNLQFFSSEVREESYKGMRVYYVNDSSDYEVVLFYIHGGYYVKQASDAQMKAIEKIVKETGCMVVIPDYPLAPEYTVDDSFEMMIELYEKVSKENCDKKICLMGDSAGGGYSLALAEAMDNYGIEHPDELILLSPWVDLSMTNPDIPKYEARDHILTDKMCKASADAWRGKRAANDWRVSPIYGDMSSLDHVTIFVGTAEMFYPDNVLIYDELTAYGSEDVTLYVGDGMCHVYPIYYSDTGKEALKQIIAIIAR